MSIHRKQRRVALKQRFKLLSGGKPLQQQSLAELPPADRLGAAVNVLVRQFRTEPQPVTSADEVRVLLDVAAHYAIDLGADTEQFANGAAFVFDEMLKKKAASSGPESA